MNSKKRVACLVTLITALLSGTAALAMEAPPIIAGDGNVDIRFSFGWTKTPFSGDRMVYDAARERVVAFGSCPNTCAIPTREYNGAYWTGVWTTNLPPTNSWDMAYDAARRVTVLLGYNLQIAQVETWLYDGTNWTQATSANSPPRGGCMVFDSVSQRVLLYGGGQDNGSIYRDFWAWDGVNWTDLGGVPADMPIGGLLACDTNRGVTVLIGGVNYGWKNGVWTTSAATNTWEWNGTTWSKGIPCPSSASSLTYDCDKNCILAFIRGWGVSAYNGASWVKTNSVFNSSFGGQIVYDAARHQVVMYPQYNASGYEGTYVLQQTNWVSSWVSGETGACPPSAWETAFAEERAGRYYGNDYGDMNGDGLPDRANGNFVYLGSSNGTFASTPCWTQNVVKVVSGNPPYWWSTNAWQMLSWVDINRDGRTDLAGFGGTDYGQNRPSDMKYNLCVYTNTGTMLATNPVQLVVFSNGMQVICADWADVNCDGFPDVAVSFRSYTNSFPDQIRVYTNNGAGNFTLAQTLFVYAGKLQFADINGDWWPDLVVAGSDSSDRIPAAFAYTNHLGAFSPMAWNPSLKSSYFDVADMDGDGDPDVVFYSVGLSDYSGDIPRAYLDACLYRNDAGTLVDVPVWSAKATPNTTDSSWGTVVNPGGALFDADGDGFLDVVTASGVFLMRPPWQTSAYDESLPAPLWLRSCVNPADPSTALVQWDPVQSPDVAGYRLYGRFNFMKENEGYLPYESYVQIAELSPTQTQFVVTKDLIVNASGWNSRPWRDPDPWDHPDEIDCDNHIELWGVVASVYVSTVDKAGREDAPSGVGVACIKATNSVLDSTTDFWGPINAVMDLNGDGALDLLGRRQCWHPLEYYRRWIATVYTNDGHGAFSKACEWRQDDPDYVVPGWSLCDINSDGRTDMLNAASSSIVNTNTGLPETRWSLSVKTNTWPARIGFAADTNGTVSLPAGWSVYYNSSPGSHGTPQGLGGDGTMTWGDANGDGWQDLAMIVASGSVRRAWLFLNHGGRLDSTNVWKSVEANVALVAFGDLEKDGKADLALCNRVGVMGAVVYKGTAEGLAATPSWSSPPNSIAGAQYGLTWFDFDGDSWQDLTVHGDERSITAPPKETVNHPTVLYKNNSGSLAYLCVYKTRDYGNGSGVGIGGSYGFTCGWADLNNDGRPDLWGQDVILQAADPKFNAGPIGIQPDYWFGDNQTMWGYYPPFRSIQGVYDFNGDGTLDFLFSGAIMLRTPNSIHQADYLKPIFELDTTNTWTGITGRLDIYPSGSLVVLDGVGATQAIGVVCVETKWDGTKWLTLPEVPVPYPSTNLLITLSGNPSNDIPYATLVGNVITAVRDGSVTVNVKYGDVSAGAFAGTYLTATKSVRVINAAKPDRLEISPLGYTLERIGETMALSVARRHSADGSLEDVTARSAWQVSDTGVITMTGQVAIARGLGVAEVVATCDGLSGTARVTVAASAGLAGLTLYPPEASVRVGETRGFEVRARFTDGTVQPVTFAGALASDAPGIASVDGLRVLGVSPGFAHITATYQGQTATALVAVDAAVTNAPAATNAPAMSQRLDILGFQRQGGNMALDWYCTTPAGQYTPFSVLTSTNLQTGPWTPIQTPVPRHPSGFHNWTGATNDSPAMFYKVTSP